MPDPRRPGFLRLHGIRGPAGTRPVKRVASQEEWARAAKESLERSRARRRNTKARRWWWLGVVSIVVVVAITLSLLWLVKSWA